MPNEPVLFDSGTGAPSPMIAQALALKAQNPDCLLFFRMGDFYELFFDDAVRAAEVLGLSLTRRGQYKGASVPMCGVPWHAHEAYIARLVRQGYKVALSEQAEEDSAAARGKKTLRARTIVRLFTPGTLIEETLLDGKEKNILVTLYAQDQHVGIAWADLAAGICGFEDIKQTELCKYMQRLSPVEIVLSEPSAAIQGLDATVTLQPRHIFEAQENILKDILRGQVATSSCRAALSGLIQYIQSTHNGALPRLSLFNAAIASMEIDAATLRNLEVLRSTRGRRQGSLLHVIDKTLTFAGARLLAQWLARPLADAAAIHARLDAVEFFTSFSQQSALHDILRQCTDIERALARLSLGRASLRDLCAVRDTLGLTVGLSQLLSAATLPQRLQMLIPSLQFFGAHHALVEELTQALPVVAEEETFRINQGYSAKLDALRNFHEEAGLQLRRLQAELAKNTGVQALKIKESAVFGRYIEVPLRDADRLLAMREKFVHRQTLSNVARFTTEDLMALDQKILEAAERARALEAELIEALSRKVISFAADISAVSADLAELDVLSSLAVLAAEGGYVRPLVDDSLSFQVQGGRHLVVEAAVADKAFVANDCDLSPARRLCLVTGPNMAGKSTFLRQNALIAILAQAGSFVPAMAAHIGVVDRLFSRIGAGDDLAQARSTFMVEMSETADILRQATPKSFVIIDEIGRGTSAQDGLAIALAALEYLHDDVCCRTLFATHYHELTLQEKNLAHLSCLGMAVSQDDNGIVFLHKAAPGTIMHSYGIHVARMAGVPEKIIRRAEALLEEQALSKKLNV